ncbi:hypothetical protein [Pseudoxanthomonas composti]|uniref:hypothetical protein n=1 Tax=Pseudoxanthomonas composti TaxID=2137479 RepID=UPI001F509B8D|nr:hypothetical protein [Pseudoxanthomonas composti]
MLQRFGPWCCAVIALVSLLPQAQAQAARPAHVRVVQQGEGYQLQVDGAPFLVKGAGMGSGGQAALVAAGGNAFRTWDSDDVAKTTAMLDQAQANGLKVSLGLVVARERHGFDYGDAQAVAGQRERLRKQVMAYKDHPALLTWLVGNELNLESTDLRVWDAVGELARMIHRLDPHHPVMTTLAGFDKPLIEAIKTRAPALDLIGIQLYGDIDALHDKLESSGWRGPYIVTEWGPTGHWESPTTAWGAAIEDDASRKAQLLAQRYARDIASDTRQGLGSYVFLWGNKQERTPTWYGLFLADGSATPSVDAMQRAWTGHWPANRSPSITPIVLEGRQAIDSVTLRPGQPVTAAVQTQDPDGDALEVRWQIREESTATSVGGDPEQVPTVMPTSFRAVEIGKAYFAAPARAGHYRLFVEVRDGKGHAAYANFPFRVQEDVR